MYGAWFLIPLFIIGLWIIDNKIGQHNKIISMDGVKTWQKKKYLQ